LTNLNFSGNYITDVGIKYLSQLPNLVSLDLSGNELTDASFQFLAKTKGEKLNLLFNNEMTGRNFEILFQNQNLKELDLSLSDELKNFDFKKYGGVVIFDGEKYYNKK
jgi:Leucine-rich repeat (LRR) protein